VKDFSDFPSKIAFLYAWPTARDFMSIVNAAVIIIQIKSILEIAHRNAIVPDSSSK